MQLSESSDIAVNDCVISQDEVSREMQYHQADSPAAARQAAAEALVIRELLKQRAEYAGISIQNGGKHDEEATFAALIETEVEAPESTG